MPMPLVKHWTMPMETTESLKQMMTNQRHGETMMMTLITDLRCQS
jgi:hypothetical protein